MAVISYFSLIIVCLFISYFQIVSTGVNSGEFLSFNILSTTLELSFVFLMNVFVFYVFYWIYLFLCKRKLSLSRKINFRLKQHKLNIIFFCILSAQMLFLISTGVGRLLSDAVHPMSPIFSLFFPEAFFPVYYILNRTKIDDSNNKLFYINVIIFSMLKLMQGWSGFILIIVFLEIHHKTKNVKLKFRYIFLSILLPLLMLSAGGFAYKYVYQFKNNVRGTPVSEITYLEGVSQLASRLSMLPVSIAAYERVDDIVKIFNEEPTFMKEVVAVGRPILPRFIMPNKEFNPLNNNVLEAYYPNITNKTSSNMGFYMYLSILIGADFIQAFLYIVILVVIMIFVFIFLSTIEVYRGQLNFILFILLMDIASVASLEVVFGYGFIKILPLFLLCWMLGGFKVAISKVNKPKEKLIGYNA